MKQQENNIRDLWGKTQGANLRIRGIPEEEKEKGIETIFEEIMSENFPNLKATDIKKQDAPRAPNKVNPNRPTPRHITIKMAKLKEKERILKAARETQSLNYKGMPIRLSDDFNSETLQARREWQDIVKVLQGKNLQA